MTAASLSIAGSHGNRASPLCSSAPPLPAAGAHIERRHGSGVEVSLDRITHRYNGTVAVEDISLRMRPGELVVLLGPSGCGKTTLLRIVAGLIRHNEGRVTIAERIVDSLPSYDRGAGIVFQNYALFPHMTVAANVGYGLRARGVDRKTIKDTVERMLALVQMDAFASRYPRELSGGQQQRIALARTLAVSPNVLLLDEPFGALDKNLRLDMQIEVKRLQRELGITTIMVTHDQEEALGMADRIAVMSAGRIEQFANPEEIYDAPQTLFVARFVGSANFLEGQLKPSPDGFRLELEAGGAWSLPCAAPSSRQGSVVVMVRPEHLHLQPGKAGGLAARVRMVLPLGPSVIYELSLDNGAPIKITTGRGAAADRFKPGDVVAVTLAPGARVSVFAA